MVRESAIKRAEELKEAFKTGHSTVNEVTSKKIEKPMTSVPNFIREARENGNVWCASCFQEYPVTAMKDFTCSVCGSHQYRTSRPY